MNWHLMCADWMIRCVCVHVRVCVCVLLTDWHMDLSYGRILYVHRGIIVGLAQSTLL